MRIGAVVRLWKGICVLAVAALVALGAGCGGGDEGGQVQPEGQSRAQQAQQPAQPQGGEGRGSRQGEDPGERDGSADFVPDSHADSGGGAEQFRIPGGDNSVQEFGSEVSGADFDRAAATLHGYYDARAAGAYRAACSFLAAQTRRSLELQTRQAGGEAGCARILADMSAGADDAWAIQARAIDVGSVRADGRQGFLLYRGAEDKIFAIGAVREGGDWKLTTLDGLALN